MHCPTELMIADYFTKPLQGKEFSVFRNLIMGYEHINDVLTNIRNVAKERVGKRNMTANSNIPKITKTYKEASLTEKKIEKIREGKRVNKKTR